MSRLSLRAVRLPAALRPLGSRLRALPDPLALLWRLASARQAPTGAALCLALVVGSALLAPRLYLQPANVYGLPIGEWPIAGARLAGAAMMATRPWGAVALAFCWLVGVVRAARFIAAIPASVPPPPAASDASRLLLYSERSEAVVRRRLRLVTAAAGFSWRGLDGQTVLLDRKPLRNTFSAAAAAGSAVAALLLLAAPRASAVEAVALVEGSSVALAAVPGVMLASRSGDDGQQHLALLTAAGDVAVNRVLDDAWSAPGLSILKHTRGPALLVRSGASPASVAASAADTVSIGFSSVDRSRLVSVPNTERAIRASLVTGGASPAFDVQLVGADGVSEGDSYRLDQPAVLTLSGVTLAFRPATFETLTVWRAPTVLLAMLAITVAAAMLLLAWALRGPAVSMAIRTSGRLVGVELVAANDATRLLWLPLLRLALR